MIPWFKLFDHTFSYLLLYASTPEVLSIVMYNGLIIPYQYSILVQTAKEMCKPQLMYSSSHRQCRAERVVGGGCIDPTTGAVHSN